MSYMNTLTHTHTYIYYLVVLLCKMTIKTILHDIFMCYIYAGFGLKFLRYLVNFKCTWVPLAGGFIFAWTNKKSSNHPDSSSWFFITKLEGSHISPELQCLCIFWIILTVVNSIVINIYWLSAVKTLFSVKLLFMAVNNKSDTVSHCCLNVMLLKLWLKLCTCDISVWTDTEHMVAAYFTK